MTEPLSSSRTSEAADDVGYTCNGDILNIRVGGSTHSRTIKEWHALSLAAFTRSETRTIPNLLGYVRSLNAAGRRDFQNDLVAALNYCREKRDE